MSVRKVWVSNPKDTSGDDSVLAHHICLRHKIGEHIPKIDRQELPIDPKNPRSMEFHTTFGMFSNNDLLLIHGALEKHLTDVGLLHDHDHHDADEN